MHKIRRTINRIDRPRWLVGENILAVGATRLLSDNLVLWVLGFEKIHYEIFALLIRLRHQVDSVALRRGNVGRLSRQHGGPDLFASEQDALLGHSEDLMKVDVGRHDVRWVLCRPWSLACRCRCLGLRCDGIRRRKEEQGTNTNTDTQGDRETKEEETATTRATGTKERRSFLLWGEFGK